MCTLWRGGTGELFSLCWKEQDRVFHISFNELFSGWSAAKEILFLFFPPPSLACRSQGKKEEAVILLRDSIKYGPDFADAYSSLASLLAEQVTGLIWGSCSSWGLMHQCCSCKVETLTLPLQSGNTLTSHMCSKCTNLELSGEICWAAALEMTCSVWKTTRSQWVITPTWCDSELNHC